MIENLTFEQVEPLVGSLFVTHPTPDQSVDLRLTRVGKVMESEAARLKRTAFSLFFTGPLEPSLPQRIYPMTHETLGTLEIFIVPVQRVASGLVYEAVFT